MYLIIIFNNSYITLTLIRQAYTGLYFFLLADIIEQT